MDRFIELARNIADREPSQEEATELLLCMIAGQYGIPAEDMRAAMASQMRVDGQPRTSPEEITSLAKAIAAEGEAKKGGAPSRD